MPRLGWTPPKTGVTPACSLTKVMPLSRSLQPSRMWSSTVGTSPAPQERLCEPNAPAVRARKNLRDSIGVFTADAANRESYMDVMNQ